MIGTCETCLCAMLLNRTQISSFNCFYNNFTCELFSENFTINSFSLVDNLASSVYFLSIPNINVTSTVTSTTQNTNSLTSTSSSYIVSLPFVTNTWNCINASSVNIPNNNTALYFKKNITNSASNMGNITVYLESNVVLTISNAQNILIFVQSGGIVQISNCHDMLVYLESTAKLTISNGGNIIAYMKSNATFTADNIKNVTIYYENGATGSITHSTNETTILCPSITFSYPNTSSIHC
ncbi:unnamed protein product [Adineta steineri]|uniref:Uncharacterized protein n=1 Tax=Adineta steineri TaxID=433720 RepID=A0A814FJX5_9BILA|nr:unnamed protein product [Adineta steineri]CAF0988875.1 unnamed protein product [Adineta steineri]